MAAGAHIQGSEQVRDTMPHVVVGAFLGDVEVQRQQRLGPVLTLERLTELAQTNRQPRWRSRTST